MQRAVISSGETRQVDRPLRSIACLVFVILLAMAFWAGATIIGRTFLHLGVGGL